MSVFWVQSYCIDIFGNILKLLQPKNMLLKTIFSSLLLLQIVSLKIPIKYLKYASNNKNIPNKVKNKILEKLFLFKNELENLS